MFPDVQPPDPTLAATPEVRVPRWTLLPHAVVLGGIGYAHIPFLYLPFNAVIGMNVATDLTATREAPSLIQAEGASELTSQATTGSFAAG
jgi:hypothetical protein